ncbi:MAG TPA: VWA domain-containing protein [Terriglobales bacterium]|nr:VWA domain-containing protein [Terriglobales bacterium]
MRRLSVAFLLVGTLVACAAAQNTPAPQSAPPAASAAADKPAPLPGFSSPVVPPKKAAEAAKADDDPDAIATFRKRVDEVNVIFTVTDKHGHFIKDLKESNIHVLDDHKPPSSVVAFRSETDLPLRVGLLIDASNSIRERFRFEQEAAMYFLSQIVRPKSDEAFVLGFDTTAEVTQDFTDNTEKLAHGVRVLRPGGGTAMYDAIYYSCRDKLMKAQAGGPVRRAIILVSDGEDNQSRVTMGETIEMAQRAEVILYAISTNTSNIKMRGDKVMEKMAEATGGRAFFPFKIEDVSNAFAEIQDELRSQYAVAYKPADFKADGRYRAIDITADNKKYHVRARKGYYAPTQ